MQDIIHLLPDSVANQIAAGEVVQRPASVVKELMENAIDAGATKIQVIVADGGRTFVQVIDNGKGMSETDARLAFERHATSKISSASDLFALKTMGFRGEALASIAAVSQVELLTRRQEDELGTRIVMSGSSLELQEVVAAPCGSSFKVKNLFFNIPARRKFLKSVQTEMNNIVTEFERVALINCDVEFSLRHNDAEIIMLPVSSFRKRILNLFGKKVNSHLVKVEVESSLINIKGFVGAPESARKKGALQFFFINGRYMRHPYFAKAVMEPFSQMIPVGEQIPFFLCFDVDPARIDVNIHPTKTEIKFEDEQSIWKIIAAAVREALGRFSATPGLVFENDDIPDIPAMDLSQLQTPVQAPKILYNSNYNPFSSIQKEYKRQQADCWEKLYASNDEEPRLAENETILASSSLFDTPNEEFSSSSVQNSVPRFSIEECTPMFQYKGQYILIPVKSGLMWIHQRRAHIRVLYEKYIEQLKNRKGYVQRMLFPERVEFTVNENLVLESLSDELSSLGFDVSSLGGGSYALNGVPVGAEGLVASELLREIVMSVMEQTMSAREKVHEQLALTMARQVAIVVGQILSNDEMNSLVDSLFKTDMPARTPDGLPVLYVMPDSDIARFFR